MEPEKKRVSNLAVASASSAPRLHSFSRGKVLLNSGEILVADRVVHRLSPKATQLLEVFIAHPDRVLEREQILALAWSGQPRTDDAITKVIAELRKYLAACVGANVELIETLPKRGYRWNGEVAALPPVLASPTPRRHSMAVGAVMTSCALLALGWLASGTTNDSKADGDDHQPWSAIARPISANIADESAATLSSDGRRIVSSEYDPLLQRYALVQRTLEGNDSSVLVADPLADLLTPSWSRDQRFVAYRQVANGECRIAILEVETRGGRDLGACPPDADAHIEFSPGGEQILVSESRVAESGESTLRMVRVNAASGERSELQLGGHVLFAKDLRYSPDGLSALVRRFDRFESLLLIDLARTTQRQIISNASKISGYDFDGDAAHAVIAAELDGKQALWRVDLATGKFSQTPHVNASAPRIARDAPVMIFRSEAQRLQLVERTAAGMKPAFESTRNEFSPSESPDGHWLAFLSDRSGSPQVYLGDRYDLTTKQITRYGDAIPESIEFTPDSQQLLVHLRVKLVNVDYQILDLDGNNPRRLALAQSRNIDVRPALLPGQFVYVAFVDQHPRIFLHDDKTGASHSLTQCEGRAPRLVADHWLYFLSRDERSLRRVQLGAADNCETVATALDAEQVRRFGSSAPFELETFLRKEPAADSAFVMAPGNGSGDLMWVRRDGESGSENAHVSAGVVQRPELPLARLE